MLLDGKTMLQLLKLCQRVHMINRQIYESFKKQTNLWRIIGHTTLEHCNWTGSDGKCKLDLKSTEFLEILEIHKKLGKPAEEFHVCFCEYASGDGK